MTSLKYLAIERNRITRLPLALGGMASLSKLRFDQNPIEWPPPEAYKAPIDITGRLLETEKEKEVCQRVKRFLKGASLKQRLLGGSAEDETRCEDRIPPYRVNTDHSAARTMSIPRVHLGAWS